MATLYNTLNKFKNRPIKKYLVGGEIEFAAKDKTLEELQNTTYTDVASIQYKLQQGVTLNADEEYILNDFNKRLNIRSNARSFFGDVGLNLSGVDYSEDASWRSTTNSDGNLAINDNQAMGIGIAANVGSLIMNAVDKTFMGDKNFSPASQTADTLVHGASSAMMKSGNPYLMAGAAVLEGVNFVTKAGGLTVEGFNVNMTNSGYGNLGNMESSSTRSHLFGLGDITGKKLQTKLQKRNEQARMALNAALISADADLSNQASLNSVGNVIRQNKVALAGGIDTSLLVN